MSKAYRPAAARLRETIAKIMAAKSQPGLLPSLGAGLAKILIDIEDAVRPENAILLEEMVAQFNKVDCTQRGRVRPSPAGLATQVSAKPWTLVAISRGVHHIGPGNAA